MTGDPYHDKESIHDLLKLYNNLKNGYGSVFLEEEAFEKIIEHYDDQEELAKALEVAETAIEYFPFSAPLLIKKADILLATRKYKEALEVIQKAELLDARDINLYILKTDAYLAMDKHEEAVALLEDAVQAFEG